MLDILLDTLIDSLKLLPFLFISFLIIELIEHKLSKKSKEVITKSGKFGPILGGLLGAVPQCGFASLATNLYITRIISIGTLISIYLSTSDEMLPILISHKVDIASIIIIVGLKVVIGMAYGFIIDLILRKKNKNDFHICDEEHCDCKESLIKSSIKHTLKILGVIFLISLILNTAFYLIGENKIASIFKDSLIFAPMLSSLIGLIPNCASSVILTEVYLSGVLSLGSAIAGLLTNSGVALIILFKNNKNIKENLLILSLVYIIGVIAGIITNLFC